MNAKDYYYKQFKKDFESFWGRVPNRPNYVTGEPLFKFAGLVKKDEFNALSDIKSQNLIYFLSALGCTILIDQVMYTHFREDYSRFQKMTLYPKMVFGWINVNPWMVFHQNVRLPRGLYKGEVREKYSEFVKFFVQDLNEFFHQNIFESVNWNALKTAMIKDPDVTGGEYGEMFKNELEKV